MIYRYFHVHVMKCIVSAHVNTEILKQHCVEIGILCDLVPPTVSECDNVMSLKLAPPSKRVCM